MSSGLCFFVKSARLDKFHFNLIKTTTKPLFLQKHRFLHFNQCNQHPNPALKTKTGITNITNSQNTKRTNGKPSEQLFPKRWPLSNRNRTKNKLNTHKRHRNSDTKTSNRDLQQTTALERSVTNHWGLERQLFRNTGTVFPIKVHIFRGKLISILLALDQKKRVLKVTNENLVSVY